MARHENREPRLISAQSLADDQILQLTSLLPTAEHFSILLRDALKSQVSFNVLIKDQEQQAEFR